MGSASHFMTSFPRPSCASLLVVVSLVGSPVAAPAAEGVSPASPREGVTTDGSGHVGRVGRSAALGRKPKKKSAAKPRATASGNKRRRRHGSDKRTLASAHAPAASLVAVAKPPPLAPSPGPSSTPEALRAQDQVAHNQIERAASAARRPDLTSRWQTVSFLLTGVDVARYPEATFWRAIAAYRRGDLEGGDLVRLQSQLPPADVTALDAERSAATLLAARAQIDGTATTGDEGTTVAAQPTAPGFRRASFIQGAPSRFMGVPNDAPYTGPAPTATPGLAAN